MDRMCYVDSLVRAKFRVKIKSLADEARTIRREAVRRKSHVFVEQYATWEWRASVADAIRQHGRDVVGFEQRHTLLAYAFFRGRPYASCEMTCRVEPDARTIERVLRSLGGVGDVGGKIRQWLQGEPVELLVTRRA